MKTTKLTFLTLLSALFITAGTFGPGYAANQNPPPVKVEKSGGDCTPAQCQQVFTDANQTCSNAKDSKLGDGFCECECRDPGGAKKIKKAK